VEKTTLSIGLLQKLVLIFTLILLLLLVVAAYPTPTLFMVALFFGSVLVILQTLLVLKEKS